MNISGHCALQPNAPNAISGLLTMESCATLSAAVVDFHRTGTLQSAEVRHERLKKSVLLNPAYRHHLIQIHWLSSSHMCININIYIQYIYVHISGYSKSLLIFHQPPNSKNTCEFDIHQVDHLRQRFMTTSLQQLKFIQGCLVGKIGKYGMNLLKQ